MRLEWRKRSGRIWVPSCSCSAKGEREMGKRGADERVAMRMMSPSSAQRKHSP